MKIDVIAGRADVPLRGYPTDRHRARLRQPTRASGPGALGRPAPATSLGWTWPPRRSSCRTSTTSRPGDAVQHRRRHRGHDPPDVHQRLGELRDGADRARHATSRARPRIAGSIDGCASATPTRRRGAASCPRTTCSALRGARAPPSRSTGTGCARQALERVEEGGRLDLEPHGGVRAPAPRASGPVVPAGPAAFRHRRAVQPLRRAAAGRGDPRPAGGARCSASPQGS